MWCDSRRKRTFGHRATALFSLVCCRPREPRGLNFMFVDPFRQSSRICHNNPDAVRSNWFARVSSYHIRDIHQAGLPWKSPDIPRLSESYIKYNAENDTSIPCPAVQPSSSWCNLRSYPRRLLDAKVKSCETELSCKWCASLLSYNHRPGYMSPVALRV